MHSMVICIGNITRGDDGVAHRVGALLEGRLPGSMELRLVPQLDIDLMDEITDSGTIVFVDAERRHEPPVDVRRVDATPHGEYGHALEPGHLLDIAWALYSVRPVMWLVTIAAPSMEHEIGLSATAEAAAREGADTVLRILGVAT